MCNQDRFYMVVAQVDEIEPKSKAELMILRAIKCLLLYLDDQTDVNILDDVFYD